MNLSYLKYAVEVEKTGSITKAAQNFYMNQPHLSKIIREMERDLGCPIFDRTGRGMIPTEKGEEFLRYAKTILIQEEQIDAMCARNNEKTLSVSLCAPRAAYIANAFSYFLEHTEHFPALDVRYMETCAAKAIGHVSGKRFQLGIIRFPSSLEDMYKKLLSNENLESRELLQFSPLLLMSEKHPLASSQNISRRDLEGWIEIQEGDIALSGTDSSPYNSTDPSQEHISSPSLRTKRSISVYDRGSQMELLNQLSGSYMWTSPVPRESLTGWNLIQKPCPACKNTCKDLLIFRKGYRLSKEDEAFLTCLSQVISRL